ncbi:hypothetical protein C8R44DRAFT_746752 [Mycena epipterygia]|nr:hypothetical protein C8R44DRAFT_746752 [Mycena epipterygia]
MSKVKRAKKPGQKRWEYEKGRKKCWRRAALTVNRIIEVCDSYGSQLLRQETQIDGARGSSSRAEFPSVRAAKYGKAPRRARASSASRQHYPYNTLLNSKSFNSSTAEAVPVPTFSNYEKMLEDRRQVKLRLTNLDRLGRAKGLAEVAPKCSACGFAFIFWLRATPFRAMTQPVLWHSKPVNKGRPSESFHSFLPPSSPSSRNLYLMPLNTGGCLDQALNPRPKTTSMAHQAAPDRDASGLLRANLEFQLALGKPGAVLTLDWITIQVPTTKCVKSSRRPQVHVLEARLPRSSMQNHLHPAVSVC